MANTAKSTLTPSRRRFVEVLQEIQFGRIHNLVLRRGEPVLDPMPRIVREIKLGNCEVSLAKTQDKDFVIKAQLVDLLERFDEIGDGSIELIQVKNGLPLLMHLAASA